MDSDNEEKNERGEGKKPIVIRNSTDLQRLKLEKLMKNPEKPVIIPEKPKERGVPAVPDFVRNVMGSSAGAGSGEFHVYRHLRRKEYARQKYMKERAERDKLDEDYQHKVEENRRKAEERTAKKRQKRLKRKQALKKNAKKGKKTEETKEKASSSEESEDSSADASATTGNEEDDRQLAKNEAQNVRDSEETPGETDVGNELSETTENSKKSESGVEESKDKNLVDEKLESVVVK